MEIDAERLEQELGLSTLCFDVIDSTSLYCTRRIKSGNPFEGVVIASEQTDGRGRVGKSFYSPKDSGLYLTFSLKAERFSLIDFTPIVALALCNSLEETFSVKCGVKWVNDIYIDQKKVAGVLCQLVDDYLLIGIGINLIKPETIPTELQDRLGWVSNSYDHDSIISLICSMYNNIQKFTNSDQAALLSEYKNRCVHIGKTVEITSHEKCVQGICVGIGNDFSLLIEIDGKVQTFSSGYMILKI